jgi:hypothetical protein
MSFSGYKCDRLDSYLFYKWSFNHGMLFQEYKHTIARLNPSRQWKKHDSNTDFFRIRGSIVLKEALCRGLELQIFITSIWTYFPPLFRLFQLMGPLDNNVAVFHLEVEGMPLLMIRRKFIFELLFSWKQRGSFCGKYKSSYFEECHISIFASKATNFNGLQIYRKFRCCCWRCYSSGWT